MASTRVARGFNPDPFQDDRSLQEALDNVLTYNATQASSSRPAPRSATNDSLLEHYSYLTDYPDSTPSPTQHSTSSSPTKSRTHHQQYYNQPPPHHQEDSYTYLPADEHSFASTDDARSNGSPTSTRSNGPFSDSAASHGDSGTSRSTGGHSPILSRPRDLREKTARPSGVPAYSSSAYPTPTLAASSASVAQKMSSRPSTTPNRHPHASNARPLSPPVAASLPSIQPAPATKASSNGTENGVTRRESQSTKPNQRKSDVPLDVIDKLDISGLYGGGGLVRHEGPYAAATAARNKGPRAPMGAFDPSALAPPSIGNAAAQNTKKQPLSISTGAPRHQPSARLSPRAAAALNAMEQEGKGLQGGIGRDGPYAAVTASVTASTAGPVNGTGSNGNTGSGAGAASANGSSRPTIDMGFPIARDAGKGQQLIEMYGVRDVEAWEDFGTRNWGPAGSCSSRESVMLPGGLSKEERFVRTQSIWDIEATLAAGKPVASIPSNPALASLDEGNSPASSPTGDRPKRSKSLARRFGRTNKEGAPRRSGESDVLQTRDENVGSSPVSTHMPPLPLRPALVSAHTTTGVSTLGGRNDSFDGSHGLRGVRSAGQNPSREGSFSDEKDPSKKPSVMQRLFSSKKKF